MLFPALPGRARRPSRPLGMGKFFLKIEIMLQSPHFMQFSIGIIDPKNCFQHNIHRQLYHFTPSNPKTHGNTNVQNIMS